MDHNGWLALSCRICPFLWRLIAPVWFWAWSLCTLRVWSPLLLPFHWSWRIVLTFWRCSWKGAASPWCLLAKYRFGRQNMVEMEINWIIKLFDISIPLYIEENYWSRAIWYGAIVQPSRKFGFYIWFSVFSIGKAPAVRSWIRTVSDWEKYHWE